MMRLILIFTFLIVCNGLSWAQQAQIKGTVTSANKPVSYATVHISGTEKGTMTDESGAFLLKNLQPGSYTLEVSAVGYDKKRRKVTLDSLETVSIAINLAEIAVEMNEMVVTGTLKEVRRLDSPVPVEVYSEKYFQKNPTPSLFDAMQNVNGVRPQLNCNVCNTGDIHINGLEGPYTMVLIDGMPIVSGLSTVYGLSGIPNNMIKRVEIVKGPASSLYGSEAVGGLINVITKDPKDAAMVSADVRTSTWQEYNIDIGSGIALNDKISLLTGVNYFNYSNPVDNNDDGFTDVTLQERISVFQKWNIKRKDQRLFSLAGRYLYEDRWGGDMDWSPEFRGSDSIYGESIYTERWELIGKYQLPVKEKVLLSVSVNEHRQDSYYGDEGFVADQSIAFGQLTWDKIAGKHSLLSGVAFRYTYYDDNTPATASENDITANQPSKNTLPGVFVQDEITISKKHNMLLGLRYDQHNEHGSIWTPRLAHKWTINDKNILRLNAGTGFRVVNIFTEDHAALTGARETVITEELAPERSYNVNLNYIRKFYFKSGNFIGLDGSAWYTHFTNQILPDYETDPNKIIYDNLEGYAVTRGVSMNMDLNFVNGLKIIAGITAMDIFTRDKDDNDQWVKTRPLLTEEWTGNWAISYEVTPLNVSIDYTGNFYGPMRLPVLGDKDPRASKSPWWSLQNIQLTWSKKNSSWEVYGGVKNLLNFTPPANSIARSEDPFDKDVTFDQDGNVVSTPENPHALSFDPTYVYAPNQGIRGFLGIRYTIR